MKKALLVLGGLVLLFLVVLLVGALTFRSQQLTSFKPVQLKVDEAALAARLSKAIQLKTISHQDPKKTSKEAFVALHKHLETSFPKVHATLKREVVNQHSLLYTWQGSDKARKPALLLAHMDVVPVEPDTRKGWKHPPFSGLIRGGFIWGRGTMDDKSSVVGILEAVEHLLAKGFKPKRTFYFAFGHDEEIGGEQGAMKIAALLKKRKVKLAYVQDEGLVITKGILKQVDKPIALIGIAGKGYVSLELSVQGKGGHSSMPPAHTTVGRLSSAIHKLERKPMPARLEGPVRKLFEYTGPEMSFPMRMLFGNLWLLGGLVKGQLAKKAPTNAMIRTTMAATMFNAGVKENVLPSKATAVVNFRILPGDSSKKVLAHVKQTIADDSIKVKVLPGKKEPSLISSTTSASFQVFQKTVHQLFPKAVVAPSLVIGFTDSRHFKAVTENTYRFIPIRVTPADLGRIHGTNERISTKNYAEVVRFYIQLLKNSNPGKL